MLKIVAIINNNELYKWRVLGQILVYTLIKRHI